MLSHNQTRVMDLREEYDRVKSASMASYQRYMISMWLTTDDVNLEHLVSHICLHCNGTTFPFLYSIQVSTFCSHSRGGKLNSSSWKGNYLYLDFQILLKGKCVFSPPFIYLFNHLFALLRPIYFILWVRYYHYLSYCSNCSTFGAGPCVLLTYTLPSICGFIFVCFFACWFV